jgi:hypothetical protein
MQDIQIPPEQRPVTVTEPPRRKRRFGRRMAVLAAVFALGWIGGSRGNELLELVRTSTWVQQSGMAFLLDGLTTVVHQGEATAPAAGSNGANAVEVVERAAKDLTAGIDQLRASSEDGVRNLGTAVERLHASVEGIQRNVLAKLEQVQGRVERVERQMTTAAPAAPAATQSLQDQSARPAARRPSQAVAGSVPAGNRTPPPRPPRATNAASEPSAAR